MTRIVQSLAEVAPAYDALFVDLWGCLHDGIRPHPAAVAALEAFREAGGAVILITNSPRPREGVERQLAAMGVSGDCYDSVATSGDAARAAMFRGAVGRRVYHMGPPAALEFYEPIAVVENPVPIERVPLAEAEGIVCIGPVDDERDTPGDYRPVFLAAKQRRLKLLCANPDIVVDRGPVRVICAGALAAEYSAMGGESLYFGKPHPPIYDLARRRLAQVADTEDARILAIGDGIATDIAGAMGEGLDSLFVTGGLALEHVGRPDDPEAAPDEARLMEFLEAEMMEPTYAIGRLR